MDFYKITYTYILRFITITTVTVVVSVTPSITDCFNGLTSGCTLPPNLGNQAVLQLQNARITNIPAGIFREYSHVKTLNLAYNNISTISPGAFVGLVSMTKLLLLSNDIENIRYTTFAGAEKLRYLNLAQNKIGLIEPGSFDGLRRLMLLNLNSNKLTEVPAGVYDGSPHLHYLYLNMNLIHTIAPTAFRTLGELKVLRVNINRLENIPNIFGDVPKLTRLGISQNPFQCDCRMEFFRRWMEAHGQSLIPKLIKEPVTCSGPVDLAGKDLRYEKTTLTCTRPFVSQVQKPVRIFEGAKKIIQPEVKGQPTPSVAWSYPSGASIPVRTLNVSEAKVAQLKEAERVTVNENGYLVISRASFQDSGRYTCKASNIAGTVTFAINISVQKKQEVTSVSMATEDVDKSYGDKDEQIAEEQDGVLQECFNPNATLAKGILLASIFTFLVTSIILTMIFYCYHKRVLARSKTFFGHFEPIPERHRMKLTSKPILFESGSSLRIALTRLSAMSFSSDIEDGSITSKRTHLNSYCSGSETTAMTQPRPVSIDDNANNKDANPNSYTYEQPYAQPRCRTGTLPQPPPQESNDTDGYMVPMKSNTLVPTRLDQNSPTVCTFDPNYATIDPITIRHL